MPNCDSCGTTEEFAFTCNYCGGTYCREHQLPENHVCDELATTDVQWGEVNADADSDLTRSSTSWLGSVIFAILFLPLALIFTLGYILKRLPSALGRAAPYLAALVVVGGVVSGAGALVAPATFASATGLQPPSGLGTHTEEPTATTPSVSYDHVTVVEGQQDPAAEELDAGRIEKLIHERVNNIRAKHSLGRLRYSVPVADVAEEHSRHMLIHGYFAHQQPDGDDIGDRYDWGGMRCQAKGENIYQLKFEGYGYTESEIARMAVEAWMDSPGHRENILRSRWEFEGIGVVAGQQDGLTVVKVTQEFCG